MITQSLDSLAYQKHWRLLIFPSFLEGVLHLACRMVLPIDFYTTTNGSQQLGLSASLSQSVSDGAFQDPPILTHQMFSSNNMAFKFHPYENDQICISSLNMSPEIQIFYSITANKNLISILQLKLPKHILTTYLFSIQDAIFSTSLMDDSVLSDQNLFLSLTSLFHIPLPIHQQILLFYIQIYLEPAHFVLLTALPPQSKALSSHVWVLTRDF